MYLGAAAKTEVIVGSNHGCNDCIVIVDKTLKISSISNSCCDMNYSKKVYIIYRVTREIIDKKFNHASSGGC